MINGISHITFVVADVEKSARMFIELFSAQQVYSSGDQYYSGSREVFLMINDLWIALMEGLPLKDKTYNHMAFSIAEDDFDKMGKKIQELGLEILHDRARIKGEGRSLYFYDYDNHLFEIHAGTLHDRLYVYTKLRNNL